MRPDPQFDTIEQQRRAGEIGVWAFLAGEILFFGVLFTGFAVYASVHGEAFERGSRLLDWPAGALNTAVLLTSSLTMALAVRASRDGARILAVAFLLATAALGALFLGVKAWEYAHKAREGHLPAALHALRGLGAFVGDPVDLFLSFYFVMTGLHALHMAVGLGLLLWMSFRPRPWPVELAGLYWHFVDVVWIFLFPVLYLRGLE